MSSKPLVSVSVLLTLLKNLHPCDDEPVNESRLDEWKAVLVCGSILFESKVLTMPLLTLELLS